MRMMRSLCCGGVKEEGRARECGGVVSAGGAVEADIDHIRNFSYREPRCRKAAAADAAMIRRGSARRRQRRGWTNRDGQTVSGRHGGRSWGKARVRVRRVGLVAGAAERETAGSGSGVCCNARLSRFVNSALPRTRVRGSLGFASAVRSSSLLADEVLGPREADRAVGLVAPMRESGLPLASLSTFSPHPNVAPQLPAPPTVRGRMPQRKRNVLHVNVCMPECPCCATTRGGSCRGYPSMLGSGGLSARGTSLSLVCVGMV